MKKILLFLVLCSLLSAELAHAECIPCAGKAPAQRTQYAIQWCRNKFPNIICPATGEMVEGVCGQDKCVKYCYCSQGLGKPVDKLWVPEN